MDASRKDKKFDDLIKQRYKGHSIEPDRALWEGINTRLYHRKIDRNTSRVRQLKIAFSTAAAILIGFIAYSLIKTPDNKSEIQNISEIPGTQSSSLNEDQAIQSSKQNNLNSTNIKDNLYKGTHSDIESKPELPEQDEENLMLFEGIAERVLDSTIIPPGIITPEEFSNPAASFNEDIQQPVETIQGNSVQADSLKIIYQISPVMSEAYRAGIHALTAENIISPIQSIKSISGLPIQGIINNSEVKYSLVSPGTSESPGKRKRPNQLFIEGFLSPEFSYRALTNNPAYSVNDYNIAYFNKTESPDISFSAGISGGGQVSEKLLLKTGVFYSRYSYRLKTEAFYITKTNPGEGLIYTSSGPVNLIFASSDSISNESLIKSSIDFSYINIPLTAEIRFRYNLFLTLGLNLNMLAWQNMNWQAEDYDGNFGETTADPIDGLEFGNISMSLGLGKEKYITRQLSLLINPTIRINLTSLNNTSPVKSYPYSWGLNAGLRYYFD